jgi:putative tricarboxylic transport membrane protein
MERSLRQGLLLSNGNFDIFFTRPISGTLMGIAVLFVLYNFWSAHKAKARASPESA